MLQFHAIGHWLPGQVVCRCTQSTFHPPPQVSHLIEQAWHEASSRPGVHLFDGPMCRLESFEASPHGLELRLSRTSYKAFVGTNMRHPELADLHGQSVLANPVGVSSALVSSDGLLLMGCRNERVAYYPGRIHPFAGALEPGDPPDPFQEIRRELAEELGFSLADVAGILCLGLVEDCALRQPELVFLVQSALARSPIESRLDAAEHRATWSLPPDAAAAQEVLHRPDALTPVAVATLLLWGCRQFGTAWFDRNKAAFAG